MNEADARESRDRTARTREAIASRSVEAPHTPRRYVGRVVAVPSGVNTPVYLDTNPVSISGDEVAGGSATRSADATRTVPVLVLGSMPAVGQDLVAKNVRGRWVAQVPGPATYTISPFLGCPPGGPGVGVMVTITDHATGALVFSGPIDSHGHISGLALTSGSSYDMAIDGYGPPRWAASVTFIAPIGGGLPTLIVLPPAPGYVCSPCAGLPISNRMELTGGRQSPVLLSYGAVPELGGAAGWRGTAPTDGTFSLPGGEDIYYVEYVGSGTYWQLGVQYDPGSGDSLSRIGSCSSYEASLGHWTCSPFQVTFPDCGDPYFGLVGFGDWTMTEAPPVP